MKTLKHFFLLTATIISLLSCKKFFPDNILTPKLPEATQEGKNTFGCYYNNVLWDLKLTCYPCKKWVDAIYFKDSILEITAMGSPINHTGKGGDIYMHIYPMADKKKYLLNNSLNYSIYRKYDTNIELKNIPELSWVEITKLDTANNIVSGLFEIHFVDTNGKIIELTDGRFDLGLGYWATY